MADKPRTWNCIYAPTRMDDSGSRHIITRRDGPTYCGQNATYGQEAPRDWNRDQLCQRCLQKCLREMTQA